ESAGIALMRSAVRSRSAPPLRLRSTTRLTRQSVAQHDTDVPCHDKETPMIRPRGILIAATLALFATGCFEVEESIDLKKDLSGTAHLKLGVDMEPMVIIMAKVQKEISGDKTPLPKAEIAA